MNTESPHPSIRRFAAVAIAAASLFFLRNPRYLLHATFYAEDGVVFFREQFISGARVIFTPLAGYLHIVPRLLAALDSLLPIRSVPFVYAVESITIASLCCAVFAMDHFRSVLRSDTLRVSLCVLAAGGFAEEEIIGNITNLQWFLVLAAVPLVLAPVQGATKKQRIFLLAFGILLSLSAPLMILFVPILLIRRVRRIDAFEIGLLFGIVVELVVMVVQGARASAPFGSALAVDNFVFSILVAFTNEVIAFTLLGRRFVFELFRDGYKVFALLLCLTFVSVETVLYKRASPRDRGIMHAILWLLIGSLVLASVRGMQSVFTQITSAQPWGAQRYFLLACWCFAFLVFLGMEIWRPAWPGWKKAAVIAVFVYGGIGNFQVAEHRARGWGNYVPAVEAWEADRRAGHAHAAVSIPIDPPGWVIELPALQ